MKRHPEGTQMRGQPDLFGEIHEDEIVKIAWEAAEERGYAIYADFNEYTGRKMAQRRLKPLRGGRFHHIIWDTLRAYGWNRETAHRPTRFYPPAQSFPRIIR